MFFGSRLIALVAGAVLLAAGRRVYWLIVGLVGFVLGFTLTAEVLEGPEWVMLVGGLIAGILASGLAVFFQKVALTVAGFLIGGMAVLWWAEQMGWGEPWWVFAMAGAAGLVGAFLTRSVFEVALIVLSSVFGATLVLEALQRPVGQISPLLVILVAAGVLIQASSARSRGSD
jgi:hypothetical protein